MSAWPLDIRLDAGCGGRLVPELLGSCDHLETAPRSRLGSGRMDMVAAKVRADALRRTGETAARR